MARAAVFVALLCAAACAAAAPPKRLQIEWEVLRDGSAIAEVTDRLEHDGARYAIEETWKGLGLYALRGEARRASRGRIVAQALRPDEFSDRRGDRLRGRARFDWAAKRVVFERGDETHAQPLPAGAADRLTVLYGFAFAPAPAGATALEVTDGRGLSTWTLEPAGRERLETPAGTFDTLRLERRRARPDDHRTTLWLAVSRDLLPVRLLVVERDGKRLERRLRRIVAR